MKNRFLIPFALAFALAGCATSYQKMGTDSSGGHEYRRLATNVFAVSFLGNGFTSPKRASDFVMLRAAEVTLEHGFRNFVVLGEKDLSGTEYVGSGGTSFTTGSANSFGTFSSTTTYAPSVTPIFKPGSQLTIQCFVDIPVDPHAGKIYLAETVQAEFKAKYRLNPTNSVAARVR